LGPSSTARERRARFGVQAGRLARRLPVEEAVRAFGVEPNHPVADDLTTDSADARRLAARSAGVDRGQREKPADLLAVPAAPRKPPQVIRGEIASKSRRRGHGKPPRFPC